MNKRSAILLFGLLAAVAAVVCVRLGIWQLHRLDERRARNAVIRSRMEAAPVDFATLIGSDTAEVHWRRVKVNAIPDYQNEGVLTTRTQSGIPGVQVITPVQPADGSWGDTAAIMVRGFVHSTDGRTIDHGLYREGDTIAVDALVLTYPAVRPGTIASSSNPRAVRALEHDSLARILAHPLAPFVLLALGDTGVTDLGRISRVPPPAIDEGPHWSYALQWFGFAGVAVVGFFAFAWSRRNKRS